MDFNHVWRRLRESVSTSSLPELQRPTRDKDELQESVPQADRDKAAKTGDAFPDGSFPITNQHQADAAWQLRGHNEHHSESAVVAHIRAMVKKHGLQMPGTTKEADALTDTALRLAVRFREATKNGGAYETTVIREGPGNQGDKNFYTREALREAVTKGMFEGLPAYADHPTASEERDRPERSVRGIVGHFREARFLDGNPAEVRAKFVPVTGEGYGWVTSLIESALKSPANRPLIGISIDGSGRTEQQQVSGQTYNMVREIAHLGSADIVTRAGAGGKFHRRLQEAWRNPVSESRPDTSKEATMKAADYQLKVKAAISKITEAASMTDEKDTEAANRLTGEAFELFKEVDASIIDTEVQTVEKVREVEKLVPATDSKADELAVQVEALEGRLRESETARKSVEDELGTIKSAQLAMKIIREANVPEKYQDSWFPDVAAKDGEDAMKAAVARKLAEREAILAEFREASGVQGAGPRQTTQTGSDDKNVLLRAAGVKIRA